MITGRLGYNSANDRYGLLVSDLWEQEGFHCGEVLEVMVDDKWQKTRMEMVLFPTLNDASFFTLNDANAA